MSTGLPLFNQGHGTAATRRQGAERIERTKHSRKPDKFREIIETLYPRGKRIELFARSKVKGWESYGNEV